MSCLATSALCKLPHREWLVLVEVVCETSSQIARIRLKKETIDTLNAWVRKHQEIHVPTGEREIFVPFNWLVPNVIMMGGKNEGHAGTDGGFPSKFEHDLRTYQLEVFGNIKYGDFVWFVIEGQSIKTAKVIFTGRLKYCGYLHEAFLVTGKLDRDGKEEIIKVDAQNLYSLRDVVKMQDATRNINLKAEYRYGTIILGPVEILTTTTEMDTSANGVGKSRAADLKSIDIFGSCVAGTYGFQSIEVESLNNHDLNIIAKLPGEMILGGIRLVCTLLGVVGGNEDSIFIGIHFEASVTEPNSPIKVRHVVKFCKQDGVCNKGQEVFIPLKLILEGDNSGVFSTVGLNEKSYRFLEQIYKNGFTIQLLPNPLEIDSSKRRMRVMGMEWENNSCYLDSIIFGMFAFTNKFDYCLEDFDKHQQADARISLPETKLVANKKICNLLRYRIVAPLRRGFCVSSNSIKELRNVLAQHYNPLYKSSYMDAEEFGLTLLGKVLRAPSFLHYDSGGEDHIYQIFAYPSAESEKDQKIPTLQALIEQSFAESSVKLVRIPDPAFIVKLPVCNGKPIFPRICINSKITLENIVQSDKNDVASHTFSLRAIVCLEKQHFTCFAKIGMGESSEWVYHNSVESPRCVLLEALGIGLEYLTKSLSDKKKLSKCPESVRKWILKIMETAYLCVYEKVDLKHEEGTLI